MDMEKTLIEGELTIYTAPTEKQRLIALLTNCDEAIELNLAKVEEIDTAGLQVLILLKREAAKLNKKLYFVMHSKAVLDVLELCNLTATFGDPIILN